MRNSIPTLNSIFLFGKKSILLSLLLCISVTSFSQKKYSKEKIESLKKELAETKRHPTIEDNVVIYANATILGGDVVIGKNSIIGANVCITESITEDSVVTNQSKNKVFKRQTINEH